MNTLIYAVLSSYHFTQSIKNDNDQHFVNQQYKLLKYQMKTINDLYKQYKIPKNKLSSTYYYYVFYSISESQDEQKYCLEQERKILKNIVDPHNPIMIQNAIKLS